MRRLGRLFGGSNTERRGAFPFGGVTAPAGRADMAAAEDAMTETLSIAY